MKFFNLALLLFLGAGIASAQDLKTTAEAPGLSVVEKSWRGQVRNPALEEDPLRANEEQREIERASRQTQRENAIRESLGLPQVPLPATPSTSNEPHAPNRPYVLYTYQAKVRNTGTKEVRKLVWEYVFFEPGTQKEVGRRRNENRVNIRPGKTVSVWVRSLSPPTDTISVTQTNKKMRDQYTEQVVIQKVEFADGTVWLRGSQ